MWQQWINLIAGLWIILSAYLNFSTADMIVNLTITGVIVAGLALWGGVEFQNVEKYDTAHTHRHA